MPQIHIPCPHDSGAVQGDAEAPDFHPLSLQEVQEFLETALTTDDWKLRNQIQIRLDQAVPGQACPRSIDDQIARNTAEIDQIYVDFVKQGGSARETAAQLFALMS